MVREKDFPVYDSPTRFTRDLSLCSIINEIEGGIMKGHFILAPWCSFGMLSGNFGTKFSYRLWYRDRNYLVINNDISKSKDMEFHCFSFFNWKKFRLSFVTLYGNNFVVFWKIDRYVSITWVSILSFLNIVLLFVSILNFLMFWCYVKISKELNDTCICFFFLLLFHSIFICPFYNISTMIYTYNWIVSYTQKKYDFVQFFL